MLFTKFPMFVTLAILISFFQSPALATKKSYIVYLGEHSHGPRVSTADLRRVMDSHHQFLGSFLGSKAKVKEAMFYSYKRVINGFAAVLEEKVVAEIAKHPDVLSILPNEGIQLQTTHSWDLLNLENDGVVPPGSLWKKARFGEDIIIANIDTGVWPESRSFNDEGLGPIPSKWKGICQNDNGANFTCNRKLIGARYFNKGYIAYAKAHNISFVLNETTGSPRDHDGHGSHTLSTAGGSFVPGVSFDGFANGTAKGGSPRARVATYKACWPDCYTPDLMKAFDMAIYDGVDVLSLSIGSEPIQYSKDVMAIGTFHAVKKGIVVVAAAGNDGPGMNGVANIAPWIITVGANKIDREFESYVKLQNGLSLKGLSLSKPLAENRLYPLVTGIQARAANVSDKAAVNCHEGALDPKKVKGKIIACLFSDFYESDRPAARAGAVGIILYNDYTYGIEVFASNDFVLPATHLNYSNGLLLSQYMNTTINPMGYITPPTTQLHTTPAPIVSLTSSRGPNRITPEILKPDISAPGYNIIAAYSENEPRHLNLPYFMLSGTSMACPHISGIASLLKSLHPEWSPAAIRSAIMTTASTRDNTGKPIRDYRGISVPGTILQPASPFAYGGGNVQPNQAMDPGLVYDLTINDYLNFLCHNNTQIKAFSNGTYKCPEKVDLLSFNNPAITVPQLGTRSILLSRTLKNVGGPGNYTARVRSPDGFIVAVEPNVLQFNKIGDERTFKLTIRAQSQIPPASYEEDDFGKKYYFGKLIWSDGHHFVRTPIIVSHADKA